MFWLASAGIPHEVTGTGEFNRAETGTALWATSGGLPSPLLGQASKPLHTDWLPREWKLELHASLKNCTRTDTISLLLHFTGQNKLQGQATFKWSRNRLHLRMAGGAVKFREVLLTVISGNTTTAVNNVTGPFPCITWVQDWGTRERIGFCKLEFFLKHWKEYLSKDFPPANLRNIFLGLWERQMLLFKNGLSTVSLDGIPHLLRPFQTF